MNFDKIIDRRGTHSAKWNAMEGAFGPMAKGGMAMWVADMDFDAAPVLAREAERLAGAGIFTYFMGADAAREAISAWQQRRHGWRPGPEAITFTHGVGNAIGVCLQALTAPGDGVVTFEPVYHEFSNKIRKNGRVPRPAALMLGADGRFEIDIAALEAGLTGAERVMLISNPHNPAGRLWTEAELRALAEICARHDMILISDEIHADLTFPGETFTAAGRVLPEHKERLVVLNSASKAFNIAGLRTGYMIIEDQALRERVFGMVRALDIQPNLFGSALTGAAYGDEGAEWLDAICTYLAGNAQAFTDGVGAIAGVRAMPMQSTYLAWVDFAGLGMEADELSARVLGSAHLVPTPGPGLGMGGERAMRFNFAMPRARVVEAVERLQAAFADLQ